MRLGLTLPPNEDQCIYIEIGRTRNMILDYNTAVNIRFPTVPYLNSDPFHGLKMSYVCPETNQHGDILLESMHDNCLCHREISQLTN